VAAYEVLMATDAVRNLVREGKTRQMRNVISTGQNEGMQTLEMDLARLVVEGHLTIDDAQALSAYPKEVVAQTATRRANAAATA
jgi:twitching motility protein PilT